MMYTQKSGNKYHAHSTEYDGQVYHSKLEAGYAQDLDLRKKAKEIYSWERQVKLDLRVYGMHITNYYIDFVVLYPDGSREYVEVKGFETPEWKMKWRILEATFDKEFKEHPDDRLLLVKQSSFSTWRPKNGKINNARVIS